MKKFVTSLLLSALLIVSSTVSANVMVEIDEALANKEWQRADLLLQKLAKQYNSDKAKFIAAASRAWIATQKGNWLSAKTLIQEANSYPVKKSTEDLAALNDTHITIKLSRQEALPPLAERIVIGGATNAYNMTLEVEDKNFIAAVNKKVEALLEEFMQVSEVPPPFSEPVPPLLKKGEFEKTADFVTRVALAEERYRASVEKIRTAYESELQAMQHQLEVKSQRLPEVRRFLTQWAMNVALGETSIEAVNYDADEELFYATVKAAKQNISHQVAIAIPIQKARLAKKQLQQSKPILVYRLNEQGLQLTNILLEANNEKIYTAKLSDGIGTKTTSHQVASVDFTDMLDKAAQVTANMPLMTMQSVTEISIAPEIQKLREKIKAEKGKQIAEQRKQQTIAKLERELNELQSARQKQFTDDLERLLAAQPAVPQDDKKYAIIIGIEKYANTHEVPFANRSAKAFANVAEKTLGVPRAHIHLLTDSQATSGAISVKIRAIASRVKEGGTLYFYYAGHGVPSQAKGKAGQPYLLAHDIDPAYVHLDDRLMLRNLFQQLTEKNRGQVVAFLDSCFSGNTDNKLVFEGVAPGVLRRENATLPNNKFMLFTAGGSHQFANHYPEKGHRLFSYYLIKGLIADNKHSPQKLQNYIKHHVAKQSATLGPAYEQTPELKGNSKRGIL